MSFESASVTVWQRCVEVRSYESSALFTPQGDRRASRKIFGERSWRHVELFGLEGAQAFNHDTVHKIAKKS